MKNLKYIVFTLFLGTLYTSCSNDSEELEESFAPKVEATTSSKLEVENFFYRGMSDIYLYKKDVAVLADNFFTSQEEKNKYLEGFSSPENLFKKLTSSQDKFSYIIEDYRDPYKASANTGTGMSFGLVSYCSSCSEVFGFVRLVYPNSSAQQAGVERGMIFNRINGQQITTSNFGSLLNSSNYKIGLAKIEGSSIVELDQTISLSTSTYNNNPVVTTETVNIDEKKVGYIYYDSFDSDYDEELNAAFGQLKAEGVSELVLDLRYNGGGSVRTATDLASMITGQFADKVFMKEQWNEKYQSYYENNSPENLLNKFNKTTKKGTAINSLNLSRVFVLTTNSSASASELIINGLDPYIDVVHIGGVTTGKFQASVALYDSPNFAKNNSALKSSHFYAIQPLVLKSLNANNVSDYVNGLKPDIEVREDVRNLGALGDPNELLFKTAIDVIKGNRISNPEVKTFRTIGESDMFSQDYKRMYIDNNQLPIIED